MIVSEMFIIFVQGCFVSGKPPGDQECDAAILAARYGSREAMGCLFDRCFHYLLRVANTELNPKLRAKGDPSDIVQETFLRAQRGFDSFKGDTEKELLAWLRTILRHQISNFSRDYLRTAKRQVHRETPLDQCSAVCFENVNDQGGTPSEIVMVRQDTAALDAALQRLPANYRRVIALRHQQGRSFIDIGAAIGRTPDAARKLLSRAIVRLGAELNAASKPNTPL